MNMTKKYAFLSLLFLLVIISSVPVKADLAYECQSGSSFHNWTEGEEFYNETIPCPYGCDTTTGSCFEGGTSVFLPIILTFSILSFVFAFIAFKLDRDQHGALQVFFVFLSLISVLLLIGSMQVMMQVPQQRSRSLY